MLEKLHALLAPLAPLAPKAPHRHQRFVPMLECLEGRAVPATFTVTATLDMVDPNDGRLSLRDAINRANTNPGADTILLPRGVFKLA